jgi:hypothetical protein
MTAITTLNHATHGLVIFTWPVIMTIFATAFIAAENIFTYHSLSGGN